MKKLKINYKTQVQYSQDQKMTTPSMVEPEQPMPLKVKPYSHQIIGYNLACRILGIFEGGG
ncbi:hypothetical protein [Youngiibacter fragilis]|uniref:Uncharacterized protein n=1 Tax=Youngiibacter fragilis 232.1 TaxID=994573 RepID=V7I2H1_9CLOT|nr:hypothetical protein [Youngiibacter fragilis]ETA80440.1 hypothetical protein T472_0211800 [Youngiibacter fragilis 232.1]